MLPNRYGLIPFLISPLQMTTNELVNAVLDGLPAFIPLLSTKKCGSA